MTASFTTTKLVDDRVLVTGTDDFGTSGKTVIDGSQWVEINGHSEYDQAVEAFEAAVEDFFRPITEAASQMEDSLERPSDSLGYVVLQEQVAASQGQEQVLVKLSKDSMILRLIEQGDFSRLVWVDDSLEIQAVAVPNVRTAQSEVIDTLGAEVVDHVDTPTEG